MHVPSPCAAVMWVFAVLVASAAIAFALLLRMPPCVAPPSGEGVVHGTWDPSFQVVTDAFSGLFSQGQEEGAQFVVYHDGRVVLDLYGGSMQRDSLAIVFSSSKVVESLVVAMLADRGLVHLDDKVAKHWPEFAQGGKESISIKQLMQHAAALPFLSQDLDVKGNLDLPVDQLDEFLASQSPQEFSTDAPAHPHGTSAYHALTRGLFVDALVRRVDGRNTSQFVHEEIVSNLPSGSEFYFGSSQYDDGPHGQGVRDRIVQHKGLPWWSLLVHLLPQLILPSYRHAIYEAPWALSDYDVAFLRALLFDHSSLQHRSVKLLNGDVPYRGAHMMANDKEYRERLLPSANGLTNAHSLAAIASELSLGGGALLSEECFESSIAFETFHDVIIGIPFNFTHVGWGVDRLKTDRLTNNIGWFGAGGSAILFNPTHRLAMAYVPSFLTPRLSKPRMQLLMNALDVAMFGQQKE